MLKMSSEKETKIPSVLSAESIRVIGETMGVSGITDEAASFLAEDISYRLKMLVQESEKVKRHSKRRKLMCSDFDSALQHRNIEPVFGHSSRGGALPFRHASGGGRELYFTEEKDLDLQALLCEPGVKLPNRPSLKAHWLSIDGVQPTLPENPPPANKEVQKQEMLDVGLKAALRNQTTGSKAKSKTKDPGIQLKNLSTHELSVEQQYYYKEITESCVGPDEQKRAEALTSLQQDPGLHQMLPRFIAFAAEGVKINVVQNNLALLIYLMRMVKSMLDNQTVFLDKYLHTLLPAVLTCVVSRQLCMRPDTDNHWALRDFAARLVAHICRTYSSPTNDLQARVTRVLTEAVMSDWAALASLYGAIAGLGELGTEVIKSCLLPYICLLGERLKAASEAAGPNNVDKVAGEHIKRQLMKYLPHVLKNIHSSDDTLDDFNIGYGDLGPMMYTMFMQKEKPAGLPPAPAQQPARPPPPQRLAPQVLLQPSQPAISSTPSSALRPLNPTTPRNLVSALASSPALGQRMMMVQQRPAPISLPPPTRPQTPTSLTPGGANKFLVIQGNKPEDSTFSRQNLP